MKHILYISYIGSWVSGTFVFFLHRTLKTLNLNRCKWNLKKSKCNISRPYQFNFLIEFPIILITNIWMTRERCLLGISDSYDIFKESILRRRTKYPLSCGGAGPFLVPIIQRAVFFRLNFQHTVITIYSGTSLIGNASGQRKNFRLGWFHCIIVIWEDKFSSMLSESAVEQRNI